MKDTVIGIVLAFYVIGAIIAGHFARAYDGEKERIIQSWKEK